MQIIGFRLGQMRLERNAYFERGMGGPDQRFVINLFACLECDAVVKNSKWDEWDKAHCWECASAILIFACNCIIGQRKKYQMHAPLICGKEGGKDRNRILIYAEADHTIFHQIDRCRIRWGKTTIYAEICLEQSTGNLSPLNRRKSRQFPRRRWSRKTINCSIVIRAIVCHNTLITSLDLISHAVDLFSQAFFFCSLIDNPSGIGKA